MQEKVLVVVKYKSWKIYKTRKISNVEAFPKENDL